MFKHPLEKIERHYKKLMPYAKKLGIELKLGTEYHVATDMIDAFHGGLCHTLADTQYILTEYSHSSEYSFVYKMTREAIFAGYIPVIAHVERYECLSDISRIEDLQGAGSTHTGQCRLSAWHRWQTLQEIYKEAFEGRTC